MKWFLASLATLFSVGASAQIQAFACPHIFEMVDYNPEKQEPIFSELKDSSIQLQEGASVVRLAGQVWPQVGVKPVPVEEIKPVSLTVEYVALLFGVRVKPEEITETVLQAFYRADLAPEDQDVIQAITVKTATATYRYLQFSHADLAICKN